MYVNSIHRSLVLTFTKNFFAMLPHHYCCLCCNFFFHDVAGSVFPRPKSFSLFFSFSLALSIYLSIFFFSRSHDVISTRFMFWWRSFFFFEFNWIYIVFIYYDYSFSYFFSFHNSRTWAYLYACLASKVILHIIYSLKKN